MKKPGMPGFFFAGDIVRPMCRSGTSATAGSPRTIATVSRTCRPLLRLVIPAKAGIQCLGFVFTSNAFAFGELLFFEGLQRKGNRAATEHVYVDIRCAAARWDTRLRCYGLKRFRLRRVTFLCKRPKKSNQKKGRFPDTAKSPVGILDRFSDSPSMARLKTAPIHGRRPFGV